MQPGQRDKLKPIDNHGEFEDLMVTKSSRYMVSAWTCSKIAVACFSLGVIAGFGIKSSFLRLVERLLNKMKDD